MKKVCIILLLFLISGNIFSHPHIFISTKIKVCFNSSGLRGLEVKYVYTDMFTHQLKQMYDINKNNIFDMNEVLMIKAEAFSNLVNYDFFVHIKYNDKKVKSSGFSNFKAYFEDGYAVYSFFLENDINFGKKNCELVIAPYDKTYYIDVELDEESVVFENNKSIKYSYELTRDMSQAYYFDQIIPKCIKLNVRKK